MLNESSYMTAIYIYIGSASLMVICMAWWLRRMWHPALVALFVLLAAALLLTPAFPRPDVATMAPALIVAGFQFFTDGYGAAEHALRPMGVMCVLAAGVALLLRLTVLKGRSRPTAAVARSGEKD